MNTTALRFPASALILLVALGLPVDQARADGDRGRTRASAPADVAGSERVPSRTAVTSDPVELPAATPPVTRPEVPASPFALPTSAPVPAAGSAAPAPANVGAEPEIEPAPASHAPDMEQLAADAAAQPAPVSDDYSLAALDAVLSDETADPISGVSDEPLLVEPEGVPRRDDVQQAIAMVVPSIRACVSGQSGRVVSVSEVFDSSGRVRTASVDVRTAHFAPSQRSCMALAARDARVPAFERETFEVTFPVRL